MPQRSCALYSIKQLRWCEQQARTQLGLADTTLMTRAGDAAFHALKKTFPNAHHLAVFCGAGNNAGDGYVVARLAHQAGFTVHLHQLHPVHTLPEAAKHAAEAALNAGVSCLTGKAPIKAGVDVVIDALLGFVLHGTPREPITSAILKINACNKPVFSLDIPTGLNADTGIAATPCINAAATATFIGASIGMYTADGPDYCGEISTHDLKLNHLLTQIAPSATRLSPQSLPTTLKPRKKNSHKGDYGHVLIIGSGPGMPGATLLAASAAFRTGAGLVSIATRPQHAHNALPGLPEAMINPVASARDLEPLLAAASVCVIGPGLGEDRWAQDLFTKTMQTNLPLIVDASALRLLAKTPSQNNHWILTPHPGEAAALLSVTTQTVQNNRQKALTQLQKQYHGVALLKGVGTMILGDDAKLRICPAGNPGMATAGMGDVLSGVIAGLVAQGLSLTDATSLGVWLHANAGDEAAKKSGTRGIIASDLITYLQQAVNSVAPSGY